MLATFPRKCLAYNSVGNRVWARSGWGRSGSRLIRCPIETLLIIFFSLELLTRLSVLGASAKLKHSGNSARMRDTQEAPRDAFRVGESARRAPLGGIPGPAPPPASPFRGAGP